VGNADSLYNMLCSVNCLLRLSPHWQLKKHGRVTCSCACNGVECWLVSLVIADIGWAAILVFCTGHWHLSLLAQPPSAGCHAPGDDGQVLLFSQNLNQPSLLDAIFKWADVIFMESIFLQLIDMFKPSTFNYLLGKSILVAPIHTNTSSVSVTFPEGSSWVDWWNHSNMFTAGSTQSFTNIPLEDYPVFFRNGKNTILVQCWNVQLFRWVQCVIFSTIGDSVLQALFFPFVWLKRLLYLVEVGLLATSGGCCTPQQKQRPESAL